jgi:hypothetical protein
MAGKAIIAGEGNAIFTRLALCLVVMTHMVSNALRTTRGTNADAVQGVACGRRNLHP